MGIVKDLLGNRDSSVGVFRDAVFIQSKTDNRGAILGDQRKNLVHDRLLAVDRVDNRLSVVDSEGCLKDLRLSGVDLERHVNDGLQGFDYLDHHSFFVDSRRADIDIEDVSARLDLLDRHSENVIHVLFFQCLSESFLACRVDSLTDDSRLRDHYGLEWGADGHVVNFTAL